MQGVLGLGRCRLEGPDYPRPRTISATIPRALGFSPDAERHEVLHRHFLLPTPHRRDDATELPRLSLAPLDGQPAGEPKVEIPPGTLELSWSLSCPVII